MKNDIVRCECVDMAVDGHGIARAGDLVVFVKEMIPGETADVKIIAEKKNYSYGIIDRLITESPYRTESACPIAYKCGGCDLRHISYEGQLLFKKKILENTFRKLGVTIEDVVPSPLKDRYRNKVQIPVKDGKTGFYRRYSHDVIENETCLLQFEEADLIIEDLKPLLREKKILPYMRHIFLRKGYGSGEVMLGLVASKEAEGMKETAEEIAKIHPEIVSVVLNLKETDDNVILGEKTVLLYGKDSIKDIYNGIEVDISLPSFYQVNHGQMEQLYSHVSSFIDEDDRVLDLYSGIGTISLSLSAKAKSVTGVEIVKEAVENAKENAKLNRMNNVSFVLGDARKGMREYLKDIDVLVLDPPRKGISEELIADIIAMDVPKIVYVSCNPATLCRDLELLKDAYDFDKVTPFDMFPQTVHVETVCCLYRQKKEFISVPYEPKGEEDL